MSETVDIVDREQIGGAGGTRGAVLAIGKLCSRPDGVLGSDTGPEPGYGSAALGAALIGLCSEPYWRK